MREAELERRLRPALDATVFSSLAVDAELAARVRRAVAAEPARLPLPRPGARRRLSPGRLRLALAAAAVAAAAAAIVAVRPWGGLETAAAALVVQPAGAAYLVSIPAAVAGGGQPVEVGSAERLPVEVDTFNALFTRWSPDGSKLVFGNGGDLFVYDAGDGTVTNMTNTADRWELLPTWSPDGRLLAFTSRELLPGEGSLDGTLQWTMNGVFGGSPTVVSVDGTGYRVLEEALGRTAPAFSPDGSTLAYEAEGTIHLANLDDGSLVALTAADLGLEAVHVGSPSWSPTRRELAVYFSESTMDPTREEIVSGNPPRVRQGYAIVDVDTRRARVVYEYEAPYVFRPPARWSPDGELLALVFRPETAISEPDGLVIVGRDGAVELDRPGLYAEAAWAPEGTALAVLDELEPERVTILERDGQVWRERALALSEPIQAFAWRAGSR
jgi:hypothetical protein